MKKPHVWLEYTGCCAFTQLRATGRWREEEIDEVLAYQAGEVEGEHSPERGFGGAPTLFCMTVSPHEGRLERALQRRGFEYLRTLPRRRGYPPGEIKMWIFTFKVDRPSLMEEVA